ncbi:MAG TPA: DUF2993 domain-containing protein, partial [Mycobacteriales bacterium]|nr:DUF2993 domain-containing protein [Mycobacteriales bacterium]
ADRVALAAAEHVVAGRIQTDQGLSERPDVTIHGFPFLTQALGGRYDRVTVHVRGLRNRTVPVAKLTVDLSGVHVPLSAVTSGHLSRVPVDRATAKVLLSYDDVNAYLGKHLTVSEGDNGEVKVTGSVTVAGQSVSASASGKVDVRGNDLVVAVGQGLDFTIPLGGLPFRIALVGAKATKAGIEVSATASGLVLHPSS